MNETSSTVICDLPDGYEPSDSEEFMNDMHREYFRRLLEKWKSDLIEENENVIDYLQKETKPGTDFADRVSVETGLQFELRERSRSAKLIKKIEAALVKIATGTYGYCEETGEPISLKRLMARPVATLSIEAQERHERQEKIQADATKYVRS